MDAHETGIPGFTIRPARESDVPEVLAFIRKLAEYERLSHEVRATEEGLRAMLFGERAYAEVLLGEERGRPVGFALFFHTFSTFVGRPGLYLEDIFVDPGARGRSYGKAMMIHLARLALARGCGRFEWSVLDWNQPSIDFYRGLGARPLDEWTIYRIAGEPLAELANGGGGAKGRA
jgi:GNAT superfamily N-acetyltransferase